MASDKQRNMHNIRDQKQTIDELKRRTDELSALQSIILNITRPYPLARLLELIVKQAAKLLHTDSGGLYLVDTQKREVCCLVSYNTKGVFTGTVLKYGEGAAVLFHHGYDNGSHDRSPGLGNKS